MFVHCCADEGIKTDVLSSRFQLRAIKQLRWEIQQLQEKVLESLAYLRHTTPTRADYNPNTIPELQRSGLPDADSRGPNLPFGNLPCPRSFGLY